MPALPGLSRMRRLQRAILSAARSKGLNDGQRVKAGFRGTTGRRILLDITRDGVERRYHATKGWRVKRVAAH